MARTAKKKEAEADDLDLLVDDTAKGSKATATEKPAERATSWYKTGDAATSYSKQVNAAQQMRKERTVPIFHLKADESAIIVFVDETSFGIHQHDLKVGDNWSTIVCTKDFVPCPICARGNKSKYVVYYTVIDTRPYTNKKGETTKFRKCLLPAKGTTAQMRIADEAMSLKKKGGLTGAVIVMKRYSAKEAGCGTILETKGKIDIVKKFGAEFAKPLDYLKILAPPTKEELDAVGFNENIIGSTDDINLSDI
jgi:hypothetical protein